MDGESPPQSGPPSFGRNQPQVPVLSTPKTKSASPAAESTAPITSRWGRFSTGASSNFFVISKMKPTITTSPANTQRQEKYVVQKPPISGPTATAIAPAAATRP